MLAVNATVSPLAMQHVASWYEGTCLCKDYGDIALSSQSISLLSSKIGSSDVSYRFCKELIDELRTDNVLVYDITSVSSYTRGISLFEYGYNKYGLSLPQINLSLVIDRQQGIPIMYDIYLGSIVDMVTISNTIKKIKTLGIKDYTLVLDRGFFTKSNKDRLMEEGVNFVMAASMSVKSVESLISGIHVEIANTNHLVMYEGKPLFIIQTELDIDKYRLPC